MMSTILLERQESNGAGQGNGVTPSPPGGGLRRTSMFRKTQHIHLVGIGGAGMSGIAEVLATLRYRVSGSDLSETPVTRRLRGLGVEVAIGHDAANANGADAVVVSTAVAPDNPEVLAARGRVVEAQLVALVAEHGDVDERLRRGHLPQRPRERAVGPDHLLDAQVERGKGESARGI